MKYGLISTLIWFFFSLVSVIVFIVVDTTYTVPEEYKLNLEKQSSCGELIRNKSWHYKSFVYIGFMGTLWGGYLGMLLDAKLFGGVSESGLKNEIWKVLVRYLVLAVIAIPLALPFILVPWTQPLGILLFFKTLVPLTLVMFVWFAFSQRLFLKLRLVEEGSQGQNLKAHTSSLV